MSSCTLWVMENAAVKKLVLLFSFSVFISFHSSISAKKKKRKRLRKIHIIHFKILVFCCCCCLEKRKSVKKPRWKESFFTVSYLKSKKCLVIIWTFFHIFVSHIFYPLYMTRLLILHISKTFQSLCKVCTFPKISNINFMYVFLNQKAASVFKFEVPLTLVTKMPELCLKVQN